MHENTKTSMSHTVSSERTCRLPACYIIYKINDFTSEIDENYSDAMQLMAISHGDSY